MLRWDETTPPYGHPSKGGEFLFPSSGGVGVVFGGVGVVHSEKRHCTRPFPCGKKGRLLFSGKSQREKEKKGCVQIPPLVSGVGNVVK